MLSAGLGTAALVSGLLVALIAVFLFLEARPAIASIGFSRMLADDAWQPTADGFGILPLLAGSALVTAGALLLATPLGVLSAVFSAFYAPSLVARWYRRGVEVLAGVPSVIFGFWGLVVLVPLLSHIEPPGQSLLAAGLVLALMVLPTVAMAAEAALRSVPPEISLGATAMGMTRFGTVVGVLIPAARSGIGVGALLATARAIGETMAVVMVAGNVVQLPSGIFEPIRTVTANVALEMGYAAGLHRSVLFATGLMLMLVIAALLLAIELLRRDRARV